VGEQRVELCREPVWLTELDPGADAQAREEARQRSTDSKYAGRSRAGARNVESPST
jgi:hypothetical protein